MSLCADQRTTTETEALREVAALVLVEGLYGRRSRRLALAAEIAGGPLAYRSRHEPVAVAGLEWLLEHMRRWHCGREGG